RRGRHSLTEGHDMSMTIGSDAPSGPEALRDGDQDGWTEDELATRRLVALVGHELRTPLAAALLYLDIADKRASGGAGTSSVRTALAVARGEVQRLEQLVRRVMELERFGRAVIHPGRCDLARVVRTAVQRAGSVYREARTRIRLEIPTGDGFIGWWDAMAVEQIVQNLLSNALRFGKGHPIQVVLESAPTGVRLVVR